jgi:hypothetical protein
MPMRYWSSMNQDVGSPGYSRNRAQHRVALSRGERRLGVKVEDKSVPEFHDAPKVFGEPFLPLLARRSAHRGRSPHATSRRSSTKNGFPVDLLGGTLTRYGR